MDENWPENWPTRAEELHIFDPEGDVLLVFKQQLNKSLQISHVFETSTPKSENALFKSFLRDVQMRVSSKHLTFASPMFRKMLNSKYSEGETLRSESSVVIPLSDVHPDAVVILMHIIHTQPKKVPRQVTLETLVELAILVDKWDILERMDLYSECWIDHPGSPKPPDKYSSLSQEVFRWLMISWVFQKPVIFKEMTRLLIVQANCHTNLHNLVDKRFPIPASIIDSIDARRQKAISDVTKATNNLILTYSTHVVICPNKSWTREQGKACDFAVLGSMVKEFSALGIWPNQNFLFKSVESLTLLISKLNIINACRNFSPCASDNSSHGSPGSSSSQVRHSPNKNCSHGTQGKLKDSMDSIYQGVSELELDTFLKPQALTLPQSPKNSKELNTSPKPQTLEIPWYHGHKNSSQD